MDAGAGHGFIHVIDILYLLMLGIPTLFTSTLHAVAFYTTIIADYVTFSQSGV